MLYRSKGEAHHYLQHTGLLIVENSRGWLIALKNCKCSITDIANSTTEHNLKMQYLTSQNTPAVLVVFPCLKVCYTEHSVCFPVSSLIYTVKQNKDDKILYFLTFFSLNSRKDTPWVIRSDKLLYEQLSQGETA